MIRRLCCALLVTAVPFGAAAHGLSVFASADCEILSIEAKFSNGKAVKAGELRILDSNNAPLLVQEVSPDETGVQRIELDRIKSAGGVVVEVDTGTHDNYWILTPEDIAAGCRS